MKLASVEKIIDIQPIEGADKIVKVLVLGWEVVCKKDEYKVGDLVSYIQIDTIVPELPEYEFLRERKYRVRSIKLRKTLSQGLIVPHPKGNWKEGDDLTDILGIKKYTKDVPDEPIKAPKIWYKKYIWLFKKNILYKLFPNLNKPSKLPFPTNEVGKTDEERIQNIPNILTKYKEKEFIVSEKMDGSSITILYKGKNKYRICSRNYEMNNNDNEWTKVFISCGFSKHIDALVNHYKTDKIIVQGEYIGKPQGNPYKVENQILLFNIIVNNKRINQQEFYDVTTLLGIPVCPFINKIKLNHNMNELLVYAEAKSVLNKDIEREGLVFRCIDDNTSFKVISNKFLIKNNE